MDDREKRREIEREKEKKRREEREGEEFYEAHPYAGTAAPGYAEERGLVRSTAESVVWWVVGIVEVVHLIRLIQAAVGADGGNALTSFVYAVSYPFVYPFFALFGTTEELNPTAPRFEFETVVAMIFYYVVGYILVQLLRAFRGTR